MRSHHLTQQLWYREKKFHLCWPSEIFFLGKLFSFWSENFKKYRCKESEKVSDFTVLFSNFFGYGGAFTLLIFTEVILSGPLLIWSISFQDQILSSMQQKLDNLCEQVHNVKEQPVNGDKDSPSKNAGFTFDAGFQSGGIKFVDCGCWLCDQHQKLFNGMEVMTWLWLSIIWHLTLMG